jgi:hypothetical protein
MTIVSTGQLMLHASDPGALHSMETTEYRGSRERAPQPHRSMRDDQSPIANLESSHIRLLF